VHALGVGVGTAGEQNRTKIHSKNALCSFAVFFDKVMVCFVKYDFMILAER
jgi:hypothetical protein